MPISECSATVKQESALPGLIAERVREGLSGRRIAATPDQEKRLAKTLERLEPAAHIAMAARFGGAASDAPFSAVLVQLSHA